MITNSDYLAVDVAEELGGDEVELVVEGGDHRLHGLLDGFDAGFQGAGTLLGEGVEDRAAHQGLNRRELHEFEVLELLLPLLLFLNSLFIFDLRNFRLN